MRNPGQSEGSSTQSDTKRCVQSTHPPNTIFPDMEGAEARRLRYFPVGGSPAQEEYKIAEDD